MKLTPEQMRVLTVGAVAGALAFEHPEGLTVEFYERMQAVMLWFATHRGDISDDMETAELFISLAEQMVAEAES